MEDFIDSVWHFLWSQEMLFLKERSQDFINILSIPLNSVINLSIYLDRNWNSWQIVLRERNSYCRGSGIKIIENAISIYLYSRIQKMTLKFDIWFLYWYQNTLSMTLNTYKCKPMKLPIIFNQFGLQKKIISYI